MLHMQPRQPYWLGSWPLPPLVGMAAFFSSLRNLQYCSMGSRKSVVGSPIPSSSAKAGPGNALSNSSITEWKAIWSGASEFEHKRCSRPASCGERRTKTSGSRGPC
ncbi:hypothetical protein V8C26DRAFT_386093 [Trichoderma gracile]